MIVRSEFSVTKWEETGFTENMPMTRASICYETDGDIKGKFNVEYIIHYTHYDSINPDNSQSTYVGFMLFEGSIGGKIGSFVLEDRGIFTNSTPKSSLLIKGNTGDGDFTDISGVGSYFADGEKMIIELEF